MFSGAQSSGKTSVNSSSLTAKTASTAVLASSCLDGGSGHPQTCPNVKRSSQTQATSSSKKQPNSPSAVTELSQAKNKQLSKMHPQAGPVDYQQQQQPGQGGPPPPPSATVTTPGAGQPAGTMQPGEGFSLSSQACRLEIECSEKKPGSS